MGAITAHNLQEYIDKYGCKFFFETGTGTGDGIVEALKYPFARIYTAEMIDKIVEMTKQRFQFEDKVFVLHGRSDDMLRETLVKMNKIPSILFWLDAHFPGADLRFNDYNDFMGEDIRCPLEKEMEVIAELRPNHKDIIICDDLRIYEDGNFDDGRASIQHVKNLPEGIEFVFRLFEDRYNIQRDYRDNGYIVLTPKE